MSLGSLDGHCHADLLLERDARFPEEYRKRACGGISWSFPEGIVSWREYPGYWDRVRAIAGHLRDEGIPFSYLVGIHPRCIPADLEDEGGLPRVLSEELNKHLADPLCLGFGEIGLDKASDVEGRILRWQLDFAVRHLPGIKRLGVHTPRADKKRVTRDILLLLRGYPTLKDRILIDHVSPETYQDVRDEGYNPVGMTVQRGKTSVEELAGFIREDPKRAESVVLGSDGAREISAWYLELLDHREVLDPEQRRRLLLDNAREFWPVSL